jgi:hypothetical protein
MLTLELIKKNGGVDVLLTMSQSSIDVSSILTKFEQGFFRKPIEKK